MNIVIVGGGSVGSSTAYHLALRQDFKGTITVIERDPTYRIASSSLSASSIRMQFSTPVCIAMSQYGWDFLAAMPEAGLKQRAYLFLATAAGAEVLRENHAVQTASGADVTLLDADGIRARFPWMNADDIALGAVGESREGWFDGPGLLAELRRRARALGVTYIAQDATGFVRAGDRKIVRGLHTQQRVSSKPESLLETESHFCRYAGSSVQERTHSLTRHTEMIGSRLYTEPVGLDDLCPQPITRMHSKAGMKLDGHQ